MFLIQRKSESTHSIAQSHDCNTTNNELAVSTEAWIDQLSVYETNCLVHLTTTDHLSIAWLMQPMKWLELIVKFKDLAYDLQFATNA